MKTKVLDYIDFEKVNILLEGFNKSTGFVTAILDLEGNVLSKSGWRQICTEFHRINSETSKKCSISDTELAGKMAKGKKYHFYKCLNGLVDVAVPVVINGEHIANLFSGQFFFERPDISFFKKQAAKYGFDEEKYIKALEKVPVVSKGKVITAMDFLLNMTKLISETTSQKLEQTELNKTIRESEERFSKIFKASPIAISIARVLDGKLTNVNETWCKLMGFSAKEALGHNVEELNIIDNETRNKIREEFIGKGKLRQLESNISTKHGEKKSILTSAEVITFGDEQLSINLVTDITERKRAETELRASVEKFRLIFESANVGKSITLMTGEINVNHAFCNMLGYSREELKNKKWQEISPSDEIEAIQQKLEPLLKGTADATRFEKRYLHKKGSEIWTDVSVVIHRDTDQKPSFFIATIVDINERKLAEKKLHESEERFRKIFEEGPLGIAMASLTTGKFISVNKAFCNMLGFTEEELMELSFRDVTYPDDRNNDVEAVRKLREDQIQKHTTEKRYQTKNGEVIWVYRSLTKIYSETDQSYIALAMVKDITERKLAEKELSESQEMFSKAFQVGPAGMTITRISDGKFINANESFCYMFEFDLNEVIGHTSTELNMWSPEERKKIIQQQIESGGLKNYELIAQAKSGNLIYLLFSSREIIIKGETCHLTTLIDITDRKQAEEELRESRASLDAALASMTDAVFISDTSGNFIEFNDAFATFHKFRNKAECAKTLAEYPDFLEVFLPNGKLAPLDMWAVPRALRGETVTNAEYSLHRKDTGESWVGSYSFSPIRDKDGVIVGSVVVGRDITELKLAEEKIRELNDELEQRVIERTSQLEAANRELEAFSYSVSHDLRAPLRHINGFADILSKEYNDQFPENARNYLNTIKDSARKMGTLIDDLLSFSRTGRTELKKSSIKMDLIVENALAQIKSSIIDRKIDWIISTMPEVYGDYNLLRLVWINLLDNAVKYTSTRKKAVIEVGYKEGTTEIIFYIKDNGVGFDMKYAQKLFGVFQRLHSASEFEGTGIGLANVQRIILRHGGRTWAEAETDKGAVFYFSIPK
jgi:PAS domain S-box-containing protein